MGLREPNADEHRRLTRRRLSTFCVVMLGYVGYYFCRANLYTALPLLSQAFGYTNTELGLIALYSEVVYSLGKFLNGPLGDRIGGKRVFVLGMVGAIAGNVAFATSASLPAFIVIWSICRFFLSMGWGGVVKMIARWYEAERNGTIMGLISLTFQFGGVAINLFAGTLVAFGVGWQGLFLYPAGFLAVILVWALAAAKDGPESVTPGVRFGRNASKKEALSGLDRQTAVGTVDVLRALLRLSMFRRILVFSVIANFLRSIFLFWSPKLLVDIGMGNANAILSSAAFPLLGGIGTVLLGWYSDRLASKGDRARLMALMLSGLTLSLILISFLTADGRPHHLLIVALIGLSGFFLLGPYSMSAGALTIDIAGPRGAATCAGFIDGVGYFGGAFSTWLAGYMSDRFGWSRVFQVLAAAGALATITALLISRAYRRELNAQPASGESAGTRSGVVGKGAVAALALAALAADPAFAQTAPRPNVVVILTDDLRPDELGAFGHPFVRTPHIDRLAREGAVFRNAFATTPLCSPSRATFLTGLYARNHRILDNTDRTARSHQLLTFPRLLHDAGYETGFIGKWHMGVDPGPRPGFDHFVAVAGQGDWFDPEIFDNGQRRMMQGYFTDIVNEHAVRFLRRTHEKPFVLFLAHKAVHPNTLQLADGRRVQGPGEESPPAERHRHLYEGETLKRHPSAGRPPLDKPALLRPIAGLPRLGPETMTTDRRMRDRLRMLASVDEGMGQILAALEGADLLDRTAVVFTSDQGYFHGEHGLSGERRLAYEESVRIPLLVRYPPLVRAGTVRDELVANIDLAPTVLALAGVRPPGRLDGRSILPLLKGASPDWRSALLLEFPGDNVMPRTTGLAYEAVRTSRFKYVRYRQRRGMDELYDLAEDPYEMRNLYGAKSSSGVLAELRNGLERLIRAAGR